MSQSVLTHDTFDHDALCRLRHLNRRLEEHYGLRLSGRAYMQLCRDLAARCIPFRVIRRDPQNRQILQVRLRGTWVLLVYSPVRQLVHTALSPTRGLTPRCPPKHTPRVPPRRHAFTRGQENQREESRPAGARSGRRSS